MYAKEMTTSDIEVHIKDLNILMQRPLEEMYAVVFMRLPMRKLLCISWKTYWYLKYVDNFDQ